MPNRIHLKPTADKDPRPPAISLVWNFYSKFENTKKIFVKLLQN